MFEHLSPTIDSVVSKKTSRWAMFLPALFFAVFIFLLSTSIAQGPSGQALGTETDFLAKLYVENSDKQIVYQMDNISLFDFILETDRDNVYLRRLKININGIYDLRLVENLKLYNDSVQLGTIKEFDSDGNIYFDLKDYSLSKGKNNFSLRVVDADSLSEGDILQFTISDRADLALEYQGSVFMPQAKFPATSGNISLLPSGYLSALKGSANIPAVLVSERPQKIADFVLLNYAEMADLRELKISVSGDNADDSEFALTQNNKLLSRAIAQDGEIIFFLDSPLVIKDQVGLELHTLALLPGEFNFTLSNARASGYNSGQEMNLQASLALGKFKVQAYYLEFKNGDLDSNLSAGWNKLYQLDLKSVGLDSLELYKLSWALDYQGVEISAVELLIDGEPYIADLLLSDNKIIAKAGWERPLIIKDKGSRIDLLVKVDNLLDNARISAHLLADKDEIVGDDLASNIIFSDGDNFFNSYQLPYLPLAPSVLSK